MEPVGRSLTITEVETIGVQQTGSRPWAQCWDYYRSPELRAIFQEHTGQ